VAGPNGKTDCGGLCHGVYKGAGRDYVGKEPALDPSWNFDLSVQKGGANEKSFRKLKEGESLLFGDIVLWNGKHMAIYAGQENGKDMIFTTTTKAGAKPMQLEYMSKDINSAPTGYYRWLYH
jgi:cell wall-associated NlpC family hydrolase